MSRTIRSCSSLQAWSQISRPLLPALATRSTHPFSFLQSQASPSTQVTTATGDGGFLCGMVTKAVGLEQGAEPLLDGKTLRVPIAGVTLERDVMLASYSRDCVLCWSNTALTMPR